VADERACKCIQEQSRLTLFIYDQQRIQIFPTRDECVILLFNHSGVPADKYRCIEVVLSVLLSNFRFAPSEKEIVWEMSNLSVPIEKGHPGKPSMPLMVIPL
jgi:hypothetical protein